MPTFFSTYCAAIGNNSPVLFFATGTYLSIFFLLLLLFNPYRKQISKTTKAKRALKKCADGTRKNPAPLPKCYQTGWNTYKRSQNLLPSDCLAFPYKKPCFLFDALGLALVATTTPFCAQAVLQQNFNWQFFVPLVFVALFLTIFQTHRLLYHIRQKKATRIHDEYLSLLDKLYQKGFFAPPQLTENQLLEQLKKSSLSLPRDEKNAREHLNVPKAPTFVSPHDRFFSNTNDFAKNSFDPITSPCDDDSFLQRFNFLTNNGISNQCAQSVCELLQKSQNSPSPKVQKQLNELLNETFHSVCDFKSKSA